MGTRAGVYFRVSDSKDGRSRSVEEQEGELLGVCKREGWRVTAKYSESDRSASRFAKKNRPEWERFLADLAAGKFDIVVLWESSRGDRRLTNWSQFLDDCREYDVKIYIKSHHHLYDLSIPRDWRTLADEGVDSAYESEKTSMRIKRDLADAAERGRPHGRLPYGYSRRYDPETRELIAQEPHPEQAPIRREIVTRVASGEPVNAIWRDLNARGIPGPTGGKWARSTVTHLVLEGEVAISKRRYLGGQLLDGDWPAIVDEDVYWRAVAVLKDPKRKPQNGGIRPGRARWMLSYIGTCAVCNGPLSMRHLPRSAGQVAYYRCGNGCVSAPVEWVDECVSEAIIYWITNTPGVLEGIMQGGDREQLAARDEAEAERSRLEQFEAQAIAGQISAASYARIARGIEQRIAELEDRSRQDAPPELRDFLGAGGDMRAVWDGLPVVNKRRVLSAVLTRIALRPARGGDALDPYRIELDFIKLSDV